jgi:hypothetical protein
MHDADASVHGTIMTDTATLILKFFQSSFTLGLFSPLLVSGNSANILHKFAGLQSGSNTMN